MTAPPLQKQNAKEAAPAEKSTPEDADDAIPSSSTPSSTSTTTTTTTTQQRLPRPLRRHALRARTEGDIAYVPQFVTIQEEDALLRHLRPPPSSFSKGNNAADNSSVSPSSSSSPSLGPAPPGWRVVSGRRLRVLGGGVQGGALTAAPLPGWLLPLVERLRATGAYAAAEEEEKESEEEEREEKERDEKKAPPPAPNHALVNCYSPGEGILPHEDGPLYHPAAAIVSLGSWAVLRFYEKRREKEEKEGEGEEQKEEEERNKNNNSKRPVFSVALAPRSLVVFTGEAYTALLHGIEAVEEEELDASVLNREGDEEVKNASREGGVGGDSNRRFIPRGVGRGGEDGETAVVVDRISLTVRRVLRVRKNLLARLGPRV